MTKNEYMTELCKRLAGLPDEDVRRSCEYYAEMIDDRVEEGCTEEEAVQDIGSIDDAVESVLRQTPLSKIVREKVKPRRKLRAWEMIFLVLGSPIWLSLLISLFAVVLSVYVAIWTVVVSFYAAALAFAAGASGGIIMAVYHFLKGNAVGGVVFAGLGLVCGGLAILVFLGTNKLAKYAALLGKKILILIKRCIVGRRTENEE